jgi:hypothetical protein
MMSTLDRIDASLHRASEAAPTVGTLPPMLRNGLVYGAFSLAVFATQIVLLFTVDERTLPLLAPVCLLLLPAFAWLGGYLTIGGLFAPKPGEPPLNQTPRFGVGVCLGPNLLLCAGLGILTLLR